VLIQNLIIYNFKPLYHILEELRLNLDFKITYVDNLVTLNEEIKNSSNYLVLINKKNTNIFNQFILINGQFNIYKLIEKINIEFLKIQYRGQSKKKINKYTLDLNSREIKINNTKLKLTEKEIDTINYLLKSKKPVGIEELQQKVWRYKSDMETHTVETHIYRLRKKFLNKFNDENFILSKKDGYQIN
jgi:hypothetical protein